MDEFQDTDPLQAELLLLLAADDSDADRMAGRATPKPGKLFLVGDPKQSIYKFRRADVVLYQEIKRSLASRGVGIVHLRCSHRAVQSDSGMRECGVRRRDAEEATLARPRIRRWKTARSRSPGSRR